MVDGPVQKMQWSHMPIVFFGEDVKLLSFLHTDALVIEANIQGWTIGKILVDTGSSETSRRGLAEILHRLSPVACAHFF